MTEDGGDDKIVHLPPPTMPPDLARQVRRLSYPDIPLEPAHDPRAAEWLDRKRKRLKPAVREQCADWLALLALGLNAVSEDMVKNRAIAVWLHCKDLDDLVWCEATLQMMWRRTSELPTPGECREVFTSYLAPILAEIAALERIASAPAQRSATSWVEAPPYDPGPAPPWIGQANPSQRIYGEADPAERRAALARVAAELAGREPIKRLPAPTADLKIPAAGGGDAESH